MKKLVFFVVAILLCGCTSSPNSDFDGEWAHGGFGYGREYGSGEDLVFSGKTLTDKFSDDGKHVMELKFQWDYDEAENAIVLSSSEKDTEEILKNRGSKSVVVDTVMLDGDMIAFTIKGGALMNGEWYKKDLFLKDKDKFFKALGKSAVRKAKASKK